MYSFKEVLKANYNIKRFLRGLLGTFVIGAFTSGLYLTFGVINIDSIPEHLNVVVVYSLVFLVIAVGITVLYECIWQTLKILALSITYCLILGGASSKSYETRDKADDLYDTLTTGK